jgi:PPOX class probable F420-dependent enzyme
MKKTEMDDFLSGPKIAKIATVRKNGSPDVAPVWYYWDGESCYVVGRKKAAWVKNIKREPRVTVLIDDSTPPYSKVVMEGKAKIVGTQLDDWIDIGRQMVKKYYGPTAGDSYLEGSKDQPRTTIRITPKRIMTWATPSDEAMARNPRLAWASRYYVKGTKWHDQLKAERQGRKGNRNK